MSRNNFREAIGPRRTGGRYYSHSSAEEYEVLGIETEQPPPGWVWQITIRVLTGHRAGQVVSHCTRWDPRKDRVVS